MFLKWYTLTHHVNAYKCVNFSIFLLRLPLKYPIQNRNDGKVIKANNNNRGGGLGHLDLCYVI